LDLVLNLVPEEVVDVHAVGAPVIGPHEDWAEARLTFENGCVAQFSASRVSPTVVRSIEVACEQGFATVDFGAKTARTLEPSLSVQQRQIDLGLMTPAERVELKEKFFEQYLQKRELTVTDHNAILEEQRDFCQAIQNRTQPQVTGHDGWRALETAERIVAAIAANHLKPSRTAGDSLQHALRGPHWSKVPARRKAS
jgi:predicted dehydrogenase